MQIYSYSLTELAEKTGCQLLNNSEQKIVSLCEPIDAAPAKIVWLKKPSGHPALTSGAAILVSAADRSINSQGPVFISEKPELTFIELLKLFNPNPFFAADEGNPVHPEAVVSSKASAGYSVIICKKAVVSDGAVLMGNNYIGPDAYIGDNTILHPGVIVERGCRIGKNCIVHAGTVIGSDGFGYERTSSGALKIPQIGNVEIGNDVEIGSNVSIDRATIKSTIIHDRVKIDNLVQIAHNVEIGEDSLIVSQSGIAGSSRLGRGVILAGQAGVADHCILEDGVIITAKSGLLPGKTYEKGSVWAGIPALPIMKHQRILALLKKLPELAAKWNQQEKIK